MATTKKKLKQGTLFSFFQKETYSSPKKPSQTKKQDQSPSSLPPRAKDYYQDLKIGTIVKVYWPLDDEFYQAQVIKKKGDSSIFTLLYDDREEETIDMKKEVFEILCEAPLPSNKKRKIVEIEIEEEEKKRRRQ